MANDNRTNDDAQAHQAPQPNPDLKNLGERLVGTWEMSAEVQIKGLEIIGHERPFGSEPSEEIKSRFYSNTGDTLDYVYELEGDTLTIWGGAKGSPAYYRGTFGDDGDTLSGAWHYPGGGGYEATSTRVG
jgi:hypothetical protein